MTYTAIKKSKESVNDNDGLSEQEKIVKEKLESWIIDVKKKTELEQRLKKAFENNLKTHTQSLSQI